MKDLDFINPLSDLDLHELHYTELNGRYFTDARRERFQRIFEKGERARNGLAALLRLELYLRQVQKCSPVQDQDSRLLMAEVLVCYPLSLVYDIQSLFV